MPIVKRHLRFPQRWYSWGLRSSGMWHGDLLDCLILKACRYVTRSVTSRAVPARSQFRAAKYSTPWSPRQGEQKYSSALSLISTLDKGWWLAPRPSRFTIGEKDPGRIVQEAGWAPALVLRESRPRRALNPGQSSYERVAIPTEYTCLNACAGSVNPVSVYWDTKQSLIVYTV